LTVDTNGGELSVALPSSCCFHIDARAAGGVVLDGTISVDGNVSPDEVKGLAMVTASGGGRKAAAVSGGFPTSLPSLLIHDAVPEQQPMPQSDLQLLPVG